MEVALKEPRPGRPGEHTLENSTAVADLGLETLRLPARAADLSVRVPLPASVQIDTTSRQVVLRTSSSLDAHSLAEQIRIEETCSTNSAYVRGGAALVYVGRNRLRALSLREAEALARLDPPLGTLRELKDRTDLGMLHPIQTENNLL